MAPLPIKFTELLQLSSIGIDSSAIGFNSCVGLPSRAGEKRRNDDCSLLTLPLTI